MYGTVTSFHGTRRKARGGRARGVALCTSILSIVFAAGCSIARTVPERFALLEEVYPTPDSYSVSSDTPAHSYVRVRLGASREDIFRAVTVALAGAGIHVETVDKSAGVILASDVSVDAVYYYAAKVGKRQGETTELEIVAKGQRRCQLQTAGGKVFVAVLSVGMLSPMANEERNTCEAISQVHWVRQDEVAQQAMRKLVADVRTRLYAAGAM